MNSTPGLRERTEDRTEGTYKITHLLPISDPFTSPLRPLFVKSIHELEVLGSGAFGTVYAMQLANKRNVALKVFNCGNAHQRWPAFFREVHVYQSLRHPNVVPIITSAIVEKGTTVDTPCYGIVMERMTGTLARWMEKKKADVPLKSRLLLGEQVTTITKLTSASHIVL
jgi:serine/threonine protein kinase